MNQTLLSVVVPVYNVAGWLPQCMDSLAALDPPADEIVAVDDGSTDESPRILAEFQARMPSLRILRQPNMGAAAARNAGLDAARGKYLAFVDSDDFVAADIYRRPLQQAEEFGLDLAMFNGWYHHEQREPDQLIYPQLPNAGPISGREWIIRHPLGKEFLHYPPLNLYRREFLARRGIRFIAGRSFHEDVPWTTEVLLAAEKLAYDNSPRYFYRRSVRRHAPEQLQRRLELIVASSVGNALDLDALISRYALAGEVRTVVEQQMVDGALSIFHKLEKMPDRRRAMIELVKLRKAGFLGFLWRRARGLRPKRRILKNWLASWTGPAT